MAERPKRLVVPLTRFNDYAQIDTSSSEDSAPILKSQSSFTMSESLSTLRSALGVLRNDSSETEQGQNSFQSFQLLPVEQGQQSSAVSLEAETRIETETHQETARLQQAEFVRLEAQTGQQAELPHREEERRQQTELVRLEAQRRQQAEFVRQEAERVRLEAELAQLYGERRQPIEHVNYELMTQVLQSIRDVQRDHHQFCVNQFRHINSRIDRLAGLLEREPEFPTKPDSLPMTTRQNIEEFETASDEEFRKIVQYLAELGGFNLNETANFMVKNSIEDSLSSSLTWQGWEPGTMKLQETKLAKAFYAGAARNKAFPKPTLKEFTEAMTAALKASKQRNRNRQRVAAVRRPRDEDPAELDGVFPEERRRREPAG